MVCAALLEYPLIIPQIFIALLKFDFFFFVGFTVQFIVIVASTSTYGNPTAGTGRDYEFYLTIVVLPLTIAFLVLAAWCTRREKKLAMGFVVGTLFAALAYFIFKLVRMYQPDSKTDYRPARRSLTTFGKLRRKKLCFVHVARKLTSCSDYHNHPHYPYHCQRDCLHGQL